METEYTTGSTKISISSNCKAEASGGNSEAMASFKIIYQKNRNEKRKIYQEPETVETLTKLIKKNEKLTIRP